MNLLYFVRQNLRRDWRSGEVRLLAAALALAVAALSAVGFFTDRVRQGMERQAGDLLAADLVVQSYVRLPDTLEEWARKHGLRTARTVHFRSMAVAGEQFQLVELKAAGDGYPLRGQLKTSAELFGAETVAAGSPAAGEAWVEAALLTKLNLPIGAVVSLGEAEFRITRVLTQEPDRGGDFFQLAPRVLIHAGELERTGLVGEGSRVMWRLLASGASEAVEAFRRDVETRRDPAWEILGSREGRPEMRSALEQSERFLRLAALAVVLLAGAAAALAAQHFARRQADAGAILRCLGASQAWVARVYALRLLALGLSASLAGVALGWLLQYVLSWLAGQWLLAELPPPSWQPLWAGLAVGLVTLAGFALPPVLRIQNVPPLRVLRRDLGTPPPALWQVAGLATMTMAGLMLWQAGDWKLGGVVLAGTAGTLLLLALAAWGLLRGLRRLRRHTGAAWRFGLANLSRRAGSSVGQLTGFGLGLMALLLLAVVRVDLLDSWQDKLPADAPNYFLINIQPEESAALPAFLREAEIEAELYPMIPGQWVKHNGQPVNPASYTTPRGQRLAQRAFNLSWSETLAAHNQLTAGAWWTGAKQASVETGIAETLNIQIGDTLTFQAGGQEVEMTVTSLRKLDWTSFKVNFFVVTTPDALAGLPYTSITSLHIPPRHEEVLKNLVRRFPGVSVLSIEAQLQQVRALMQRAAQTVEAVFALTLLAGVLVLYAAIQASRDERLREGAILRTLGASRRQIFLGLLAEFATLGGLAGLLAAGAAEATGAALALWVFDLPWQINPWLWLIGMCGGAAGVGLAGILGARALLKLPPSQVLRLVGN